MKRLLLLMLTAVFTLSVLAGCGAASVVPQQTETPAPQEVPETEANPGIPTATPNPNITKPEGQVMGGENPYIEGKITALTEDAVTILAEGVYYELDLGTKGKRDLGIFNKDESKPMIMLGTYIIAYYRNNDGVKTVESLEILEAN
ncbi:MAG: hypothetical protein IJA08_03545 [Clostridia bacterium]|nr:hypothetical protein [Clostridia bacterium]